MPPALVDILTDVLTTLRDADVFGLVTLGDPAGATALPRSAVVFDGQDELQPDDHHATRWMRFRARVVIRTRSEDPAAGLRRVAELAEAAATALLTDPYRGQLCCDLPVGRATEIGPVSTTTSLRRPAVEASFLLTCHYELQEAQA